MDYFLITGATSGIGKSTSLGLLKRGVGLICIVRDLEKFHHIYGSYDNVISIEIDLKNIDEINGVLEIFFKNNNLTIKGVLIAGGIETTTPIKHSNSKLAQDFFNINILSSFEIISVIQKKSILNHGGSIVFLSSVMGSFGSSGKTLYSSTKGAINGLVKSLSVEFMPRKIAVNAVAPGMVNTPMTDKMRYQLGQNGFEEIMRSQPLGLVDPEELAKFIIFLLTSNELKLTGQVINYDGGYSVL